MGLIGQYKNGNYKVKIYKNGTKIRETEDNEFIPEFPESMDISITDRCDRQCKFCYAGATPEGKHGDIMGAQFIDKLRPFTEVALNGNDLTHPDLVEFLAKLKQQDVIASMTVNQEHFMGNKQFINMLVKTGLIKGIGVSLNYPDDEFIAEISKYKNAVIHVINGITKLEHLEKLYDKNLKILILGYKTIGRGKEYYSEEVERNIRIMYENIEDIGERFAITSYDNLALDQLELKRLFTDEIWDEYYMGDDGKFTMYVDIPKNTYSKNSLEEKTYELKDNPEEMFKNLV